MDKKLCSIIDALPSGSSYGCRIYPDSVHWLHNDAVFMYRDGERSYIVGPEKLGFEGTGFTAACGKYCRAELSHKNASILRELFPFTAPSPVLNHDRTIGCGDRLGLASPGHIRALKKYDVYPVLAQQSIRELKLTGRCFDDVIDSASFAVFRENYTRPFGSDGDHLKTFAEIDYALSSGCTMVTLDCSEHIRGDIPALSDSEAEALYTPDSALEERYLGKSFRLGDIELSYTRQELIRCSLIYGKAIEFALSVYDKYFRGSAGRVQLEISIDETSTDTSPLQHFFVANELHIRRALPVSMAPRFCGQFQKGVNYRGDLKQFEKEFIIHRKIASFFGYKLSIHSGSDKFAVFPCIREHCGGRFHLKTAGTSWLEAMAAVAEHDPELYRHIHRYCLNEAFYEARKYYEVSCEPDKIPKLSSLSDEELPGLFENDDARQLIHICYGLILNKKTGSGGYEFKDRLYRLWHVYEDDCCARLERHISKHLELLCGDK